MTFKFHLIHSRWKNSLHFVPWGFVFRFYLKNSFWLILILLKRTRRGSLVTSKHKEKKNNKNSFVKWIFFQHFLFHIRFFFSFFLGIALLYVVLYYGSVNYLMEWKFSRLTKFSLSQKKVIFRGIYFLHFCSFYENKKKIKKGKVQVLLFFIENRNPERKKNERLIEVISILRLCGKKRIRNR